MNKYRTHKNNNFNNFILSTGASDYVREEPRQRQLGQPFEGLHYYAL